MSDLLFGHASYISPFTWRYGSAAMREVWSEVHKRRLFRRVWVALATAQRAAGLVTDAQLEDLRAHQDAVDIERSAAIEAEIHHDPMAEVKVYAEQCPVGGGIIHLGATSMDISDNAEVLRIRESLDLILQELRVLLMLLVELIEARADQVCMAFTHLQPAEPTTVGYRLAQYAQDLLIDFGELARVRQSLRGKGIKGAVGTSASYAALLEPTGMTPEEMESRIMAELDLPAFPVATQVYPRKQDWLVLNALAGLSGSLYKFAFDLRLLQAPSLGEWSEPLGRDRLGRQAMLFKGIRFNQRTSIRWPGTSPHCLVLPGTMRRIPCSSAHSMTRGIAARFCRRRSWRLMRSLVRLAGFWAACRSMKVRLRGTWRCMVTSLQRNAC